MFTREDLKNLTDAKLLAIANVLQLRDDWVVSKKFTEEQQIYEVLADGETVGKYEAVVQILFGDQYEMDDITFNIRHFDYDWEESSPTEDEMIAIAKIILR